MVTSFLKCGIEREAGLIKSAKYTDELSNYYKLDSQWARYLIDKVPVTSRSIASRKLCV